MGLNSHEISETIREALNTIEHEEAADRQMGPVVALTSFILTTFITSFFS
jgi:hypothetical protein